MAEQPAPEVEHKESKESEETKESEKVAKPKELKGYPLDIRAKPEKHQKELYSCASCKCIARKAVELSCEVHLEDPTFKPIPYCEGRLHFQLGAR